MTGDELEEVALSLRRRRLQLLLEEMHALRDRIKAARRSRRKRARLLHLARSRGLKFSLGLLKSEGMTIWQIDSRSRATYDPCITRYYLRTLRREWRDIRQRWKTLREQSTASGIENLRALLEETRLICIQPPIVQWEINDLHLEDVLIGDLEVMMRLDCFSVTVGNPSVDVSDKGGYAHPHVDGAGGICWNGHDEAARVFHAGGDFLAVKDMVESLLHTYNEHSPYITLEDWENGVGASCDACGERYPENELYWSEQEEELLCEECRAWCRICEEYVPWRIYSDYLEACLRCVAEGTEVCERCGAEDWRDRMHESEETWICGDCRDKQEENDEKAKTTGDPDAPGLLAPAMDGAAHVE